MWINVGLCGDPLLRFQGARGCQHTLTSPERFALSEHRLRTWRDPVRENEFQDPSNAIL
jgi:hypothetical protein